MHHVHMLVVMHEQRCLAGILPTNLKVLNTLQGTKTCIFNWVVTTLLYIVQGLEQHKPEAGEQQRRDDGQITRERK